MVQWKRFEVDGAKDLPDWYDDDDRYYHQTIIGNLLLTVFTCCYNDLFMGWGWRIELNGNSVAEFTFRSHHHAFDTSKEARSSAALYVQQFFPKEWERHQAGMLFPE